MYVCVLVKFEPFTSKSALPTVTLPIDVGNFWRETHMADSLTVGFEGCWGDPRENFYVHDIWKWICIPQMFSHSQIHTHTYTHRDKISMITMSDIGGAHRRAWPTVCYISRPLASRSGATSRAQLIVDIYLDIYAYAIFSCAPSIACNFEDCRSITHIETIPANCKPLFSLCVCVYARMCVHVSVFVCDVWLNWAQTDIQLGIILMSMIVRQFTCACTSKLFTSKTNAGQVLSAPHPKHVPGRQPILQYVCMSNSLIYMSPLPTIHLNVALAYLFARHA